MTAGTNKLSELPVVKELKNSDQKSGDWTENLTSNSRMTFLVVGAAATLLFASQAVKFIHSANFEKFIVRSQSYVENYYYYKYQLIEYPVPASTVMALDMNAHAFVGLKGMNLQSVK